MNSFDPEVDSPELVGVKKKLKLAINPLYQQDLTQVMENLFRYSVFRIRVDPNSNRRLDSYGTVPAFNIPTDPDPAREI